MEQKTIQPLRESKRNFALSITGKPMQLSCSLNEFRLKKKKEYADNQKILCTPYSSSLSNLPVTTIATSKAFLFSKKYQSLTRSHSKTLQKKEKSIGETFELEDGSKIYKCVSNPNINGNSSTLGFPLRASTAINEMSIIYKQGPEYIKRTIFTSKVNRVKPVVKKESLHSVLQKCNGIQFKEEEESASYRYFIGSGNNSDLISRIMKNRKKWKRIYSTSSANFIWTSTKKNCMYEYLASYEPDSERNITIVPSEYPGILPHNTICYINPAKIIHPYRAKVYNRLFENRQLVSKKRLFYNMCSYYNSIKINPFTKIPLTFHVSYGSYDTNFKFFMEKYKEIQASGARNVWIVKPGEGTNRGIGIRVCKTVPQIVEAINYYDTDNERTYIIQKYIENPLLYNNRKFDIRGYAVVTSIAGNIQCYFYKEGYLRTSCVEFSVNNVENRYIHLTNDAVQKHAASYGKHESGNKLSYAEFQAYLSENHPEKNFYKDVLPQIKDLVRDSIMATYSKIDPHRKLHSFEIFGYDFMIDSDFHAWLIEVNTNPCLELSSPYLEILIPKMLDQAFSLTIDMLFPCEIPTKNDFELVFNEALIKYNV